MTEPIEYTFNIGHKVTKRCSSEGVANHPLFDKNLPRPDSTAGTEVTSYTEEVKKSQNIKPRDTFPLGTDSVEEASDKKRLDLANHMLRINSRETHR